MESDDNTKVRPQNNLTRRDMLKSAITGAAAAGVAAAGMAAAVCPRRKQPSHSQAQTSLRIPTAGDRALASSSRHTTGQRRPSGAG